MSSRKLFQLLVILLVLALPLAGCGEYLVRLFIGSPPKRPDDGAGRAIGRTRYERPEASYTVGELPEIWQQMSEPRGDFEFFASQYGAVIASKSTCQRFSESPLPRLADDLLLGITNREFIRQQKITFAEREAYDLEVKGKLDGVPVQMWARVLKKHRCIFDFTLVAPPERFEKARPDFQKYLDGFTSRGD